MYKVMRFLALLSPFYYLKTAVARAEATLPPIETGITGAEQGLAEVGAATSLDDQPLTTVIGSIIEIVLGLLGIVFVVLIVYAGFLWMTAGGGAEQVKKAKGILTNAIIGLIITIAAYAISAYVIEAILTAATEA